MAIGDDEGSGGGVTVVVDPIKSEDEGGALFLEGTGECCSFGSEGFISRRIVMDMHDRSRSTLTVASNCGAIRIDGKIRVPL